MFFVLNDWHCATDAMPNDSANLSVCRSRHNLPSPSDTVVIPDDEEVEEDKEEEDADAGACISRLGVDDVVVADRGIGMAND